MKKAIDFFKHLSDDEREQWAHQVLPVYQSESWVAFMKHSSGMGVLGFVIPVGLMTVLLGALVSLYPAAFWVTLLPYGVLFAEAWHFKKKSTPKMKPSTIPF